LDKIQANILKRKINFLVILPSFPFSPSPPIPQLFPEIKRMKIIDMEVKNSPNEVISSYPYHIPPNKLYPILGFIKTLSFLGNFSEQNTKKCIYRIKRLSCEGTNI